MRALLVLALVACGSGKRAPAGLVPADLPITGARYQNAHLLGAPGRELLGGFVPPDAWPIDPSIVRRTACSEHFRVVEGPAASIGQAVFGAPPSVAQSLGIPTDDGADAYVAWADVKPGNRKLAAIADPSALASCCAGDPDACTERYVAELITGDGTLYRPDGGAWLVAAKVGGPFGFRLGGNPYVGEDCGTWREGVPLAAEGSYFLGVSKETFSEQTARADAIGSAKAAARAWVQVHGKSDAIVGKLREERWCVESYGEGNQARWLAHVLVYVPVE